MLIKSKSYSWLIAVIVIVLIISFPDISSIGVSRGLLISANVIIPSLFPFMVFVLMLIKSEIHIKNRILNNILYTVFGHNFDMFFVFVLSLIGGYPIGARLVNEMLMQKKIDNKTANIMLMYCVNAGPAFIVSVVGSGVFNSQKIGFVLLLSHITASILIAIFCGRNLKKLNCEYQVHNESVKPVSQIFVESVADACGAMLSICCFVILFSAINSYLDFFFGSMSILKYISYFTEVTSAVIKTKNIFFISFLLGFSGLSIWCQVFAMSKGAQINILRFCFGRIMHGTISVVITKLIIVVFKIKISIFSNNINPQNDMLYSNTALFFAMTIMLIVLLTFLYSKNNSGKFINDVI